MLKTLGGLSAFATEKCLFLYSDPSLHFYSNSSLSVKPQPILGCSSSCIDVFSLAEAPSAIKGNGSSLALIAVIFIATYS